MILLATPTAGQCATPYVSSLADLLIFGPKLGLEVMPLVSTCGPGLYIARNTFAAIFMQSAATHLLFVDSDMRFAPSDVARLVESGHDIVAAPYQMKMTGAPRFNVVPLEGAEVDGAGFVEVKNIGTGLMLISRAAFAQIRSLTDLGDVPPKDIEPGLRRQYRGYFDIATDEVTGEVLTEDYAFCQRARRAGVSIYADCRAQVGHIGPKEWAAKWDHTTR